MRIHLLPNVVDESSELDRQVSRMYQQLDVDRCCSMVPDPGSAIFANCVLIMGAEPTVVYPNRILSPNFTGVALSSQMDAEVSGRIWVSNELMSGGAISCLANVMDVGFTPSYRLVTGISREPISAYELSRRFGLYARSLIARQGVKLISTNIRDWASLEDPEWKQLVIDFEVEAESDTALALWDRLNDELQDFIDTLEGKFTSNLCDLISITVQWK